jgi:multidrug efflux pump subunit AcrB
MPPVVFLSSPCDISHSLDFARGPLSPSELGWGFANQLSEGDFFAMEKLLSPWIDRMVARTKLVTGITIGITVLGLVSLWNTKRDLHPPFEFNTINVSISLPEASPAEVERLITYPVEEALLKMADLKELNSTSLVGQASLRLTFSDQVKDLQAKSDEVRSKVQSVLANLPNGITRVTVEKESETQGHIFLANYAILGIDETNRQHHQFVSTLKRQLLAIPDVSKVETSLRPLHPYILFDPRKLHEYKVSPATIRSAVRNQYSFQSVSYYNDQGSEWLIELDPAAVTPEQIREIPLFSNSDQRSLKVGDVAKVEWRQPPLRSYNFLYNGQDTVEFVIFKGSDSDSISLFEVVKDKMKTLSFPEGVRLELLYDGPYFVQQQISVLVSNGFGGLVLVLIMLGLAMSWKTSLMTAIGLPVSYFGTFVILKSFGFSIDLISLIAMILVVGNLVDDAVIMAERYTQLLEEGLAPEIAATTAAKELITPVTGTILTIICAFLPMLFVEGNLSKIFAAIPIVIGAALFLSWFETFFILPNHLAHFVRTPPKLGSQKLYHHLSRFYKRALSHTLRYRYFYGFASMVLLAYTVITASKMPQNFELRVNPPQIEIYAEFRDGTTLEQAKERLRALNEKLLQYPKHQIDFVETNQGWIWRQGKVYRGAKYAMVRLVINKEASDPALVRDSVFESVQKKIEDLRGSDPSFIKLEASANERGGGDRMTETVTVKITGKDERAFSQVESLLIQKLANQGHVGDYILPDDHSPLTYRFKPEQARLTALGLSLQEVSFQLQAQTSAVSLLDTRFEGDWMSIMLSPQELKKPELADLRKLILTHSERQSLVPISYLGSWMQMPSTAGISHIDGERVLRVQFHFDGKETNEQVVMKEIDALLKPIQTAFPQLKIETQDSNLADKKGREWTLQIVSVAAVLIFLILAFVLKSFMLPFVVGLPIPFAMVGVIWALKMHDLPLGLMSMIGLIGTMGVAVNDSIVMVDQIHRLKKKYGVMTKEVILEGAASRLRAITLTATCTLIGVFPTAYGLGGESGFTQPLAFSMGWGLTTSLLLTLFIIPGMLQIVEDSKMWVQRRKTGLLSRREPFNEHRPGRPRESDVVQTPSRPRPVIHPETLQ